MCVHARARLEYRKRKELLDHLWAVIEEEFWRIDRPRPTPSLE
jgi:hypothetical protein